MKVARWFVTLLCVLLVAAVFGPALPRLHSHLLGIEYVDHYGTQWFYWFVENQLRNGEGMGWTDLYFYPWGKDIFLHTGANVLDGYLAMPFRVLLGPTLGYNVFVLLGLVLSALAFAKLAGEFTEDRLAVALSSVLFVLSPFVMFEMLEGRPTQAILVFPVLFLLFVFRSGSRTGLRWPVLAGIALALCGYQYWFYAFFGGMVCMGHGVVRFARPPPDSGGRWRQLGRHALIAAVALGLTLPAALPLLMAQGSDVPGLLDVERWSLLASPPITVEDQTIGLFLWQPFRRFAGFYVIEMGPKERLLAQAILVPFTSWLALVAYLRRPGRLPRGVWIAMALVSITLAMGPIVILHKWVLPNPFFVWLVKSAGFMQRLWWPARAVVYLVILFGLVNTMVLAWAGRKGRRWQVGVATGLSVLWGVELYQANVLPYPAWDATIPAGYRCLASGPPGAIMELPYSWTQAHLYYQSVHGRPLMGGMLENNPVFTPPEFNELKDNNAFVSNLFAAAKLTVREPEWTDEEFQEVYDLGYRYVVVQKDAFVHKGKAPGLVDNVLRLRMRNLHKLMRKELGAAVYDDARVAIYSPWGAEPPCDPRQHDTDKESFGLTEVSADSRILRTPDEQLIHRLWIDPEAYELGDEDDLGTPASIQVIPGKQGTGYPIEGAAASDDAEGGDAESGAGSSYRDLPPSLPPPLDQASPQRRTP